MKDMWALSSIRPRAISAFAVFATISLLATSSVGGDGRHGRAPAAAAARAAAVPAASIKVLLSIDWEGTSLNHDDLAAIHSFRERHPAIPFVQFLNAAYYTHGRPPDVVTEQINRAIRIEDEIGLRLHGLKTLFEAAGVPYRSEPDFNLERAPIGLPVAEVGSSVAISHYNERELGRVISFSKETLRRSGFPIPVSFRAGAWLANNTVLAALVETGFVYDHSAVPAAVIGERAPLMRLGGMLETLWPNISTESQPYRIYPQGLRFISEIPNNSLTPVWLGIDNLKACVDAAIARSQAMGGEPKLVSVAIDQEHAAEDGIPPLDELLEYITVKSAGGVAVQYVTSEGASLVQ